jgi:uncharacterized protein (TIGR02246 family)
MQIASRRRKYEFCNFILMKNIFIFAIFFPDLFMSSCNHSEKQDVEAVIKKYERLTLKMDADSISKMYAVDGELGNGSQHFIKGRDSIYSFLSSFTNVRVLSNADSIKNISFKNDEATVTGIFRQTVLIDQKDTVMANGQFIINLIPDKNKRWLIQRAQTKPL